MRPRCSPEDPAVTLLLALSAARRGRDDEAIEWLRKSAVSRQGPARWISQMVAAELALLRGQLTLATRLIHAALAAHIDTDSEAGASRELYVLQGRIAIAHDRRIELEQAAQQLLNLQCADSEAQAVFWAAWLHAELAYQTALGCWLESGCQLPPRAAFAAAAEYAQALADGLQAHVDRRDLSKSEVQLRLTDFARGRALALTGAVQEGLPLLVDYHARAVRDGQVHEIRNARLAIGALHCRTGNFALARQWLAAPLVNLPQGELSTGQRQGLYLASLACEAIGDHPAALVLARRVADSALRAPVYPLVHARSSIPLYGSDEQLVERALAIVRERLDTPLTVAQITDLLGVSRRRLEYAFKRTRGVAPKRALTTLRLSEAQRRFETSANAPRVSLESLACAAGFPSYQTFACAVQRQYSIAPSALCRRWRESRL